jgi:hypothetical protein
VLLVTDPAKAREVARRAMALYLPLTNYRKQLAVSRRLTSVWPMTAIGATSVGVRIGKRPGSTQSGRLP